MKTHHLVSTGTRFLPGVVGAVVLMSALLLTGSALGQADPDILDTSRVHDLSPVGKVLRSVLWSFAFILLTIAAVVTVLRRRASPSLYKTATDEQWQEDSLEVAAVKVDEDEVAEACEDFGKPKPKEDENKPPEPEKPAHHPTRLYRPASGPAWDEPMLNAFISACLKANCLGRAWREEAAHRQQTKKPSLRLPDPREAEFVRRLKARWQEFHVDPDNGIFVEHATGASTRTRVCIIKVTRQKHAVAEAAFNAGFVIESVGRYLKSTDQVYPTTPGCYHIPTQQELAAFSYEQKKHLLRLKHIPEPWQSMIAGVHARDLPVVRSDSWSGGLEGS